MKNNRLVAAFLLLVSLVVAQNRIPGPSYAPWIRKTADLTNMVEKIPRRRFRCAYPKKLKDECLIPATGTNMKVTMREQTQRHQNCHRHHHRSHHKKPTPS
ncbi:hypothetical protein M3Y98_00888900 [Aphelenchoides besseyi]|nr:hypothetical protein M3Y98_00888900 [Aphelenchoides besseyi]KAI6192972.1 hypothetical protein M3Y96_00968900 [Aphelenchoides besseyi]